MKEERRLGISVTQNSMEWDNQKSLFSWLYILSLLPLKILKALTYALRNVEMNLENILYMSLQCQKKKAWN